MDSGDPRIEPVAQDLHRKFGDYRRIWSELPPRSQEIKREQAAEILAIADSAGA